MASTAQTSGCSRRKYVDVEDNSREYVVYDWRNPSKRRSIAFGEFYWQNPASDSRVSPEVLRGLYWEVTALGIREPMEYNEIVSSLRLESIN